MLRDISADKAIERQLAAAYSYDTLTSIPNRALFMDRLGEAVRTARLGGEGVALMVCDIDRFRAVNDTAGHRTADDLLRIVARRLERQIDLKSVVQGTSVTVRVDLGVRRLITTKTQKIT